MTDFYISIKYLYPTAEFTINANDYEQINWISKDIQKPSKTELINSWEKYVKDQETLTHQKLRENEYPPIGDQLDAILKEFSNMKNNGHPISPHLGDIIEKWDGIKNKYPKG